MYTKIHYYKIIEHLEERKDTKKCPKRREASLRTGGWGVQKENSYKKDVMTDYLICLNRMRDELQFQQWV